MSFNDLEVKQFLKERADSHNARYGHIDNKFCEVDVLIKIYERHKHYCNLFSIKSKREQQKLLKTRIREYMRVLRTGFIKDVLDNLVWEDLELLPEGHRMKPPYKISIYTKEDPMEYLTKAQELSDIYLQNNPFILEEEE